MFKKQYFKLGLVVVLLLAALFSFSILAQAAEDDYYTITVDYDKGCKTVVLTYGSVEQEMASGTQYKIPVNAVDITLTVELKGGYDVESATGTDGTYFDDTLKHLYGSSLIQDQEIHITTRAKTYGISYKVSSEGTPQYGTSKPSQHTFGTATTISNPTLTGYDFVCWLVLPTANTDPATVTDVLYPVANSDYALFPAEKIPSDGSTIYLMPKWEAKKYRVDRIDVVYSGNNEVPMLELPGAIGDRLDNIVGTVITGAEGVAHEYPGYYFNADVTASQELGKITVKPYDETGSKVNTVYRFYSPRIYKLSYNCSIGTSVTFPEGVSAPLSHTFNATTLIPDPILTGYDFAGWTVEVYNGTAWVKVENCFGYDNESKWLKSNMAELDSQELEGERTIRLTAQWTPKTYDVTFDWAGASGVVFDSVAYGTYTYNQNLEMIDPVRTGYTFLGWSVVSGALTGEINSVDGKTVLPANTYTESITLTARWQANTYQVTLNGNGADSSWTSSEVSVTFDSPFALPAGFVFPNRVGHNFIGFSLDAKGENMYTDALGQPLAATWTIAGDTTLYAQWERCRYSVSVTDANGEFLSNVTSITINGTDYTGTPISVLYNDPVTVVITMAEGYKMVQWQGMGDTTLQTVSHAARFEYTFVMGAADQTLVGRNAPVITVPAFCVDYLGAKESLKTASGAIPNGKYLITDGTVVLEAEIVNGVITVKENGTSAQVDALYLWEGAFGSTLQITVYGDGVNKADSDVVRLSVAARPAAPQLNNGNKEISSVYQHEDTNIIIQMTLPVDLSRYEFAYAENNEGLNLVWKSADELGSAGEGSVMFSGLKPGTTYYVYVRVKAVEGQSPHGQANCIEQATKSEDTLDKKISELLGMMQDGDGEMVNSLIQSAINEANALTSPSPDFYDNLQAIVARVESGIAFARTQDARIAELTQLRDRLLATGEFSSDGEDTINMLWSIAVTTIKNATATDTVQAAYVTAKTQIEAVPVSHLKNDPLEIYSDKGLPQGIVLVQKRFEDLNELIASVNAAIGSGNIAVGGNFMTPAQASEVLQTLEVMAAYTMRLTQNNVTYTAFEGGYEVWLLLSTDLRDETGLQIGYYDNKTGLFEVLETKREGNCLVFYTDRITDFVILGDPTVNLMGLMGALSLILLCQLIAILMLAVRRIKNAKRVRHYSFAILPVLLTVRFQPNNSLLAVAILGGLVIVFQILLMYLLITSDLFLRKKTSRPTDPEDEMPAQQAYADLSEQPVEEPDTRREEPEQTFDEESANAAMRVFETDPDTIDVDTIDADIADDDAAYDASDAVYDDSEDDFIEPAPNPRYSLEDSFEDTVETLPESEDAEEEHFEEMAEEAYASVDEDFGEESYEEAYEEGYEESEEDASSLYAEESDEEDFYEEEPYEEPEDESVTEESTLWQDDSADWQYDNEEPVDEYAENEYDENGYSYDEEADPEQSSEDEELYEDSAYDENAEDAQAVEESGEEEEPEDEFYVIPDATGDEAPAPEGYPSEDSDERNR